MWIDARDRLPDDGEDVLVYLPEGLDGKVHTAFIDRDNGEWYSSLECTQIAERVTHWTSLPDMPKPETVSKPHPTARVCGQCDQWERGICNLPKSPRFTDTTSATDGCTPNKKARADWI